MKLNTKFGILISSFVIVTMGVSLQIFSSFSELRQMQEFEKQTLKMNLLIEEIYAFPPTVLAIRADPETLVSDWKALSKKANDQMNVISSEEYRSLLSKEESEYLDTLLKVWAVIIPQLNKVETSLVEFTDLTFSRNEALSMKSSGATKITLELDDSDNRKTIMNYMINRIIQATSILMDSNDTFSKVLANLTSSLTTRNENSFRFFIIQNLLILCAASIVVFMIALTVTRRITKRVKLLRNASDKLAQKDFTVDISNISKGKDEISYLAATLSDTIKNLSSFLEVVKDSSLQNVDLGENISLAAHNTASATHEIRSNIESLRKQFDNIEAAVQTSVESLNRMSSAVMGLSKDNNIQSIAIQESDKASSKMALSVEKIRNMAEANCSSAEDMQEAVAYGDQKIEASNSMIREVATQIKGVADIVDVINSVAEQTNILAMNAAIESAHAGESGKGFAVVAEEIRILAESTGENSKRISDSLFTIISRMREVTDYSESAAQAFADINGKSTSIHKSLSQILDNISEVADEAEKVAAFSQKISSASEKMNAAYDNLNTQRESVSSEMEKLENVVALSRNGIDEIKIGAEDIVERMLSVNEMSSKSRTKMTLLSNDLNQFKTKISDFVVPAEEQIEPIKVEEDDISKKELHDAIFGEDGDEIETKEDIIEATKLSLQGNQDNLQTEVDVDDYNTSEYELASENTENNSEEITLSQTELQAETEQDSQDLLIEAEESVNIDEAVKTEGSVETAEAAETEKTAEAAESEESTEDKEQKYGLLATLSNYSQTSEDDAITIPLDDFDTLFNDYKE